jgi:hypothetical protein
MQYEAKVSLVIEYEADSEDQADVNHEEIYELLAQLENKLNDRGLSLTYKYVE